MKENHDEKYDGEMMEDNPEMMKGMMKGMMEKLKIMML
jgi:hypothetical protein